MAPVWNPNNAALLRLLDFALRSYCRGCCGATQRPNDSVGHCLAVIGVMTERPLLFGKLTTSRQREQRRCGKRRCRRVGTRLADLEDFA